jgi:hypothetical protein
VESPGRLEWFLERVCREVDGPRLYRPDGKINPGFPMLLLLATEQIYLHLNLDKVFPVKQSVELAQIDICHWKIPTSFDGVRIL